MKRMALIDLRPAVASDFTINGLPKWGAVYFQQSATGVIERNILYLQPETDKTQFKLLFDQGQIWVFKNASEVVKMCIDEMDHETSFEMVSQENQIDLELKKQTA